MNTEDKLYDKLSEFVKNTSKYNYDSVAKIVKDYFKENYGVTPTNEQVQDYLQSSKKLSIFMDNVELFKYNLINKFSFLKDFNYDIQTTSSSHGRGAFSMLTFDKTPYEKYTRTIEGYKISINPDASASDKLDYLQQFKKDLAEKNIDIDKTYTDLEKALENKFITIEDYRGRKVSLDKFMEQVIGQKEFDKFTARQTYRRLLSKIYLAGHKDENKNITEENFFNDTYKKMDSSEQIDLNIKALSAIDNLLTTGNFTYKGEKFEIDKNEITRFSSELKEIEKHNVTAAVLRSRINLESFFPKPVINELFTQKSADDILKNMYYSTALSSFKTDTTSGIVYTITQSLEKARAGITYAS
jgi:hypothetical protein